MRIVKASAKPSKKSVKASTSRKSRAVRADEDIDIQEEQVVEEGVATVAPEATDMLFEAEDVAELVAEVTGQEVTVEVDDADDSVIFTVGDEEFTVEPEGDEEILEASRKALRGKSAVRASRRAARPRRVAASSRAAKKPLRRR